jgi:hypothetical protein
MQVRSIISTMVFALVVAWMPGAQAQSAAPQQTAQQNAVKRDSAQPNGHSRAVGHSKKTTHHSRKSTKRAKRAAYRPEYAKNSVEVINGSSTQKVQFNNEEKSSKQSKRGPSQLKVEEVNGSATSTRYFYVDKNQPAQQQATAGARKRVVVGVQSSDTRFAGGNKHPVVTAITDAGPSDATSTTAGGERLTTGVAGKPKRAPYQP